MQGRRAQKEIFAWSGLTSHATAWFAEAHPLIATNTSSSLGTHSNWFMSCWWCAGVLQLPRLSLTWEG
jgi:hypothetical protein